MLRYEDRREDKINVNGAEFGKRRKGPMSVVDATAYNTFRLEGTRLLSNLK